LNGSGDENPCGEGEDCDDDCVEVEHEPCDEGTTDPFMAMGINCPDELQMPWGSTARTSSR
jgi:hypothetical protein